MFVRYPLWLMTISCLVALGGCAQMNLGPISIDPSQKNHQTFEDPITRAKFMADQTDEIRRTSKDTVIRRIRSLSSEKCLTEVETELMVADFTKSLNADLEGLQKSSRDCCRAGSKEDATTISNRVKDLNARFANYRDPASEAKIFALITTYGPQASAPRQSDICKTRMQKIAEFAKKQQGKQAGGATGAVVTPGKTDPEGIEVLLPEFEKKIGTLELYRNLIGPVSSLSP